MRGMAAIARALRRFGATYTEGSRDAAARCVRFQRAEKGQRDYPPDTLHVLPVGCKETARAVGGQGNFLLVQRPGQDLIPQASPSANIIVIPPGNADDEVLDTLEATVRALGRMDGAYGMLLDAIELDEGFTPIIDACEEVLGNPFSLYDSRTGRYSCGSSRDPRVDELWRRIIYDRDMSYEEYSQLLGIPLSVEEFISRLEHPVYWEPDNYLRRILAGVWVRGTCTHGVSVLELNHELTEEDLVLCELICDFLSSQLGRHGNLLAGRAASLSELLEGVLEGSLSERAAFLWARDLSIDLTGGGILAIAGVGDGDATYAELVGLSHELAATPGIQAVTTFQQQVVAIAHESSGKSVESAVKEAVMRRVARGWRTVVSHHFHTPTGLKGAYAQCQAALRLCQGDVPTGILRYRGISLRHLVGNALEVLDAEDYVIPLARQIVLHDAENDTHYAETILTWRHLMGDRNEVGRRLFIHPNTVGYRLARIEETFGVDLGDWDLVEDLCLSLTILSMS